MWRKRILRAMICITIIMALVASTSILTFAAKSIDPEEVINEITNSIDTLKEREVAITFTVPETTELTEATQETTYPVSEASFDTASSEEYGFVNLIVTIPNETEAPATEPMLLAVEETISVTEVEEDSVVVQEVLSDDPLAINLVETHGDGTKVYNFKGGIYTVPYNPIGNVAQVSKSGYVEKITEVPQFFQQSYPKKNYGSHGTVSSHGCGITSCAMVYSYLLDRWLMPDELAETYGRYNTPVGSAYALFTKTAEDFGVSVEVTYNWEDVVNALENGSVVIANVQKESIFTDGGHFIVYYGITDEGKILINDPSIYNYGQWAGTALTEGFESGFDQKYCKYSFPCWIYAPKDIELVASLSVNNNA